MTENAQWSAPSIGQVVELAAGELPREFRSESELTPMAARIFGARALWPTPRAEERVQHNSRDDYQALSLRVQLWPTPRVKAAGESDDVKGGRDLQTQAISLWPTPNSTDWKGESQPGGRRLDCDDDLPSRVAKMWPTASASASDGKGSSEIGQRKGQLSEAILWATATATDAKASGAAYPATETRAAGVTLTDQACRGLLAPLTEPGGKPTSSGGLRLSPLFVEALMGFPIAFTDCDYSATPSSRTKQPSRGASYGLACTETVE